MADPQQQQGGKPGAMADLDAALGLTEAWLQGDPDVARWAADDGDASPPARGGGAWPSLDAELDAAALAREDAELDALVLGAGPAVAAGGGALGGPSFDPFGSLPLGSDPAGLSGGSDGSQDGEGDVGPIPDLAAGRAGGGGAAGNPAAAAAAEEARRGVEGIELMEDIDAEPGDTMAPGQLATPWIACTWLLTVRLACGPRLRCWLAPGRGTNRVLPPPAAPPAVQARARCRSRRHWGRASRGWHSLSPRRRPSCLRPQTWRRQRQTLWRRWRQPWRATNQSEAWLGARVHGRAGA